MIDARRIAAGFCLLITLAAGSARADGIVRLDPAAAQRLGLVVTRLTAVQQRAEIDAFAKVLDPGPLVQLDSDLEIAVATAAASGAEARRARSLYASGGSVSAKAVEAAVAQAKSDALHVALLRDRLGLEWGPGIARLSDRRRADLVRGLSAGDIAVVHVDTHNNDGQDGARFVRVDIGANSVRGPVIGPARTAEPRLQSSGLIVEITGKSAILLSVGLTQSAHIETATPQRGVLLPRRAVIRYRGSDWAYVQTGPGAFERRLLSEAQPQADGLFVSQGLSGADDVVTDGVSALFAAEQAGPVSR